MFERDTFLPFLQCYLVLSPPDLRNPLPTALLPRFFSLVCFLSVVVSWSKDGAYLGVSIVCTSLALVERLGITFEEEARWINKHEKSTNVASRPGGEQREKRGGL